MHGIDENSPVKNLVENSKGSNIRFAEGAMGRLRNLCDSFDDSPSQVALAAVGALAALIVLVFGMVTCCVGLFPGDIVIVVTALWFTGCNSAVSSLCVPCRSQTDSGERSILDHEHPRSQKGMTMDEHYGKSESRKRNPNREPTCYLHDGFTFLLSPYLAL